MSAPWKRLEPGWYHHDSLGAVCYERAGWYWYPPGGPDVEAVGPHPTMRAAMRAATGGDDG